MKEEILFLTHKKNNEIEDAIRSLRDSMGDRKLTILSQSKPFDIKGTELFQFEESIVHRMDFPTIGDSIVPGHTHFPVFAYISNNKADVDYYWVIEYDVRFSGEWSVLFDHFLKFDEDFLTSHIHYYYQEPDWYWWEISHPEISIPKGERIRSFNPIYRISTEAFTFLVSTLKSGWRGHYEVILPTLLYHNGYKLLDFGANGNFTSRRTKNFCINRSDQWGQLLTGTMRYRPAMKTHGMRRNKLYHPVKGEDGLGILRSNAGNFYRLIKLWFNKLGRKMNHQNEN